MFKVEDELQAGDCEWETFTIGVPCPNDATKVIIEITAGREDFHWAHLCETHIKIWEDYRKEIVE